MALDISDARIRKTAIMLIHNQFDEAEAKRYFVSFLVTSVVALFLYPVIEKYAFFVAMIALYFLLCSWGKYNLYNNRVITEREKSDYDNYMNKPNVNIEPEQSIHQNEVVTKNIQPAKITPTIQKVEPENIVKECKSEEDIIIDEIYEQEISSGDPHDIAKIHRSIFKASFNKHEFAEVVDVGERAIRNRSKLPKDNPNHLPFPHQEDGQKSWKVYEIWNWCNNRNGENEKIRLVAILRKMNKNANHDFL